MWISIYLSIWGFTDLSESVVLCILSNLGRFQPVFLHIFFIASLSSPFGSSVTQMLDLLLLSHRTPIFKKKFQFFFFLLLRLDNFYWSAFMFTDSSIFILLLSPSIECLNFCYCDFLYCLLLLCWGSLVFHLLQDYFWLLVEVFLLKLLKVFVRELPTSGSCWGL